ncbi:HNH endonuclease [Rossellomorea vietnamensis]|uniref:HNH endonuclease n=1 Tax=Rossellomorea vietnamensis TaxID=218284 RepID=UPI00068B8F9D|nr:HNH endonuclease [Rossellomorea vietnamensis]
MKKETYEHLNTYIHLLNIDYENGKILNRKPQIVKPGYEKIKLKGKIIGVHQVISFIKYGAKNIGLIVNHIDGCKLNNKPENLEIVTYKDNTIHAYKLGLRKPYKPKGIEHTNAKLTDDKVREIRTLIDKGMLLKDIAVIYKVHYTVISKIKSGERWTHVI